MGYWLLAIGRWQMANNMMIILPVKCTVLPRNTRIRKVVTTAEVSNAPRSSCPLLMKALEVFSPAVTPHVKVLSFAVLSVLYWDTRFWNPIT